MKTLKIIQRDPHTLTFEIMRIAPPCARLRPEKYYLHLISDQNYLTQTSLSTYPNSVIESHRYYRQHHRYH